jgi:hypothetical protein
MHLMRTLLFPFAHRTAKVFSLSELMIRSYDQALDGIDATDPRDSAPQPLPRESWASSGLQSFYRRSLYRCYGRNDLFRLVEHPCLLPVTSEQGYPITLSFSFGSEQFALYRPTTDDNAIRKGWHMPPKMAGVGT